MRRLIHDTNERNAERLSPILDLSSPSNVEEIDVWQAYGLYWLLCEIVGFAVRGSADDVEDGDRDRITDITYSLRRWAYELRASEAMVMTGFRTLAEMGLVRIAMHGNGQQITIGLPHLDDYADRSWTPKRARQQRDRRAAQRDTESTPSRRGVSTESAPSRLQVTPRVRKTDRKTRGKSVCQTSAYAGASDDAPQSGRAAEGGSPAAAPPATPLLDEHGRPIDQAGELLDIETFEGLLAMDGYEFDAGDLFQIHVLGYRYVPPVDAERGRLEPLRRSSTATSTDPKQRDVFDERGFATKVVV